ncbi:hypothetical protein A2215_01710 [Candidatus Berkelbacteria bacterium RIFOXYA2_FULL_43_10]|uniref:Type II secretion system protein GspG C-terminal domain-containing protein n=1 Tax=Candidatus Berkelbacteria bacterium RIFOXYA2_FULL_43_10 TaxID=1797472 RepID=A0A1F5E6W9_9BACT|nr:MAG: hypothetical protein A2215_01710 [Candidatus Berkelbacteria bacterium RIFOXYA2_FULL_43_10]
MYKKYSKRRGFTLIELLIVVAIIGILAAIISIVYVGAQEKSRDSKRKADLQSIASALTLFYNDNKRYVGRGSVISDSSTDSRNSFPVQGSGATGLDQLEEKGYLSFLPSDPLHKDTAGKKCQYVYYQNTVSNDPPPLKATNFKVISTNAEALGDADSECKSNAGEFADSQYSCKILQVSSSSTSKTWNINNSAVNGDNNFSGCQLK